jgi:hypothetical protein
MLDEPIISICYLFFNDFRTRKVFFSRCSAYVYFSSNARFEKTLSYARAKKRILELFPYCGERVYSSVQVNFKKLQLVRARNRPIRQLFAQFLAESNYHHYASREWPPALLFPYKGHAEHKYPL